MGRKAEEPLQEKGVTLFQGDWDELAEILRPRRITPTVFIRKLVRRAILQIKAKAEQQSKPLPEIEVQIDDLEEPS